VIARKHLLHIFNGLVVRWICESKVACIVIWYSLLHLHECNSHCFPSKFLLENSLHYVFDCCSFCYVFAKCLTIEQA
jgi:hypothetical protein